jgi:hypothetical protein
VESARYQWFLVVDTDTSEMGSFQLDPGAGGACKIAAFSDPHTTSSNASETGIGLQWVWDNHQPDLLLCQGDIAQDGTDENYAAYFNSCPQFFANVIVVPVPGNHDGGGNATWQAHFPNIPATPYSDQDASLQTARNYFMDYGNITFVVSYRTTLARDWWTDKINKRDSGGLLRPMIIAANHHGESWDQSSVSSSLLQAKGGIIWFKGHGHNYHRTHYQPGNMTYIQGPKANSTLCGFPWGDTVKTAYPPPELYQFADHSTFAHLVSDSAVKMAVVEVQGEGMIHYKCHGYLTSGTLNPDPPVKDSFEIDATQRVADYCAAYECNTVAIVEYSNLDNNEEITAIPNPFNPEVSLSIEAASSRNSLITIYSANGAAVLQQRMEMGQNSFVWNARNMPSGVYFVSVTIGSRVMSKRVIHAK